LPGRARRVAADRHGGAGFLPGGVPVRQRVEHVRHLLRRQLGLAGAGGAGRPAPERGVGRCAAGGGAGGGRQRGAVWAVAPRVDLVYRVTPQELKEEIVLAAAPADPAFTFTVDTAGL